MRATCAPLVVVAACSSLGSADRATVDGPSDRGESPAGDDTDPGDTEPAETGGTAESDLPLSDTGGTSAIDRVREILQRPLWCVTLMPSTLPDVRWYLFFFEPASNEEVVVPVQLPWGATYSSMTRSLARFGDTFLWSNGVQLFAWDPFTETGGMHEAPELRNRIYGTFEGRLAAIAQIPSALPRLETFASVGELAAVRPSASHDLEDPLGWNTRGLVRGHEIVLADADRGNFVIADASTGSVLQRLEPERREPARAFGVAATEQYLVLLDGQEVPGTPDIGLWVLDREGRLVGRRAVPTLGAYPIGLYCEEGVAP